MQRCKRWFSFGAFWALGRKRADREAPRLKVTGSLRRLTVFVRYENVVRLLEYLRYSLE
jgi:hypothetical protein